jgi:hypothetical protein
MDAVTTVPCALRRALLVCLLAFAAAGCGTGAAATCDGAAPGTCTRVLFIGNSYTFVNDLPATFAALARAGARPVQTSMVAPGGAFLADEVGSPAVADALAATKWDVVVLQEQSEAPAVPSVRAGQMAPAARALAARIRASGGQPVLFMTWAHRDGLSDAGLPDYASMQRAIDDAYLGLATELGVPVAPVGYLWSIVRTEAPSLALWQDDGSHPSRAGTYLAACVFYAVVFRQSPVGLAAGDGVSGDDARVLQGAAASVLDHPAQWGLR